MKKVTARNVELVQNITPSANVLVQTSEICFICHNIDGYIVLLPLDSSNVEAKDLSKLPMYLNYGSVYDRFEQYDGFKMLSFPSYYHMIVYATGGLKETGIEIVDNIEFVNTIDESSVLGFQCIEGDKYLVLALPNNKYNLLGVNNPIGLQSNNEVFKYTILELLNKGELYTFTDRLELLNWAVN